jgi:pimeloyl-ACP methyl ester carboxylesterase
MNAYLPQNAARSEMITLRGLRQHVLCWGDTSMVNEERPPLVLMHGWADVAASYQFMVDALTEPRFIVAADWRGFGKSENAGSDSYWFADYLGDLDALIDHFSPTAPVDLVGHSMGGNAVMMYAGARPSRVRRLVNLEGFGMPHSPGTLAPKRMAQWLDELKTPQRFKPFANQQAVAERLRKNNPLLSEDKALWLAGQWAAPNAQGEWEVLCDPGHKRVNPILTRAEEVIATYEAITAPLLWVQGNLSKPEAWWGGRYSRAEFEARLAHVKQLERCELAPAGHMLHHDQPQALAQRLETFLGR